MVTHDPATTTGAAKGTNESLVGWRPRRNLLAGDDRQTRRRVDLKAPQTDDRGFVHPAYGLIREVQIGDVVFHYDTDERHIAQWSKVASAVFEEDIVWGSHGTVARVAGVRPYRRPGWRALLEGPVSSRS